MLCGTHGHREPEVVQRIGAHGDSGTVLLRTASDDAFGPRGFSQRLDHGVVSTGRQDRERWASGFVCKRIWISKWIHRLGFSPGATGRESSIPGKQGSEPLLCGSRDGFGASPDSSTGGKADFLSRHRKLSGSTVAE